MKRRYVRINQDLAAGSILVLEGARIIKALPPGTTRLFRTERHIKTAYSTTSPEARDTVDRNILAAIRLGASVPSDIARLSNHTYVEVARALKRLRYDNRIICVPRTGGCARPKFTYLPKENP